MASLVASSVRDMSRVAECEFRCKVAAMIRSKKDKELGNTPVPSATMDIALNTVLDPPVAV